MSKITFAQKVDVLNENMRGIIRYHVTEKGIKSKHSWDRVIPTKWEDVSEIGIDYYNDMRGYKKSYSSLSIETLAQVADFVTAFKKPKVQKDESHHN